MPIDYREYPPDWKDISKRIRFERANGKCEWCGAENYQPHPITGSKVILTVAHMNDDKMDISEDNLFALCQRCHLQYDLPKHIRNRRENAQRKAGLVSMFTIEGGGDDV